MSQRLQLIMSGSEHLRHLYGSLVKTSFWRSSERLRALAFHRLKAVTSPEQGVDANVKAAEAVRIVLSERDFGRFLEVIEAPPKPTDALLALVRRRRSSGR